jgi:hypothetical protein
MTLSKRDGLSIGGLLNGLPNVSRLLLVFVTDMDGIDPLLNSLSTIWSNVIGLKLSTKTCSKLMGMEPLSGLLCHKVSFLESIMTEWHLSHPDSLKVEAEITKFGLNSSQKRIILRQWLCSKHSLQLLKG